MAERGWKGAQNAAATGIPTRVYDMAGPELYVDHDERLMGMGRPPGDPVWAQQNPGMGSEALTRATVETDPVHGAPYLVEI